MKPNSNKDLYRRGGDLLEDLWLLEIKDGNRCPLAND